MMFGSCTEADSSMHGKKYNVQWALAQKQAQDTEVWSSNIADTMAKEMGSIGDLAGSGRAKTSGKLSTTRVQRHSREIISNTFPHRTVQNKTLRKDPAGHCILPAAL
eukprot:1161896-Pelagomonas_calceolata.AAC.1